MKSIKHSVKFLVLFSLASITASLVSAQPLITVDEFGNGNFNGQPLPSFQSPDPFSGIVTLTYRLPFPGVPGDVQLFEPNAAGTNILSDIIRFDGNGNLYFFSEIEPTDVPPFDPADVGQFPPPVAALPVV